MIISKYVEIELTKRNFKKSKKSYNIPDDFKIGDLFKIPIELLSNGTHFEIDVLCDYCNKPLKIPYKRYIKNTKVVNKYACSDKECSNQKIRDVCQVKYGVDNPFQAEFVKEKSKATFFEKHGVEHQMYLDSTKEKIRQTCLEKYGVDNFTKTDEFKEKSKQTCLNNYGVEYSLQSKEVREKSKITSLKKYGVEFPSQSKDIRRKVINTCLNKWGFETNLQSTESKEKIIQTCLDKYGVTNPAQSDLVRKANYAISQNENCIKYIGNRYSLFLCKKHNHEFEISSDNYHSRISSDNILCTICYPIGDTKSIMEIELYEYIKSVYLGNIIQSYRDKFEIDIYLPELNIGFEFNGVYWHSDKFKEKDAHLNKTNYFKERNIRIIHIWEDDWKFKRDILKSQIDNIVGLSNPIYGRKCIVKEINDVKLARDFLDNNHIQGFVNSNVKIGLYYNDELISLMIFDKFEGRKKMSNDEWNLSRFCNKKSTNVIGGASKLLKYFIKQYNPARIISYADKDWSIGNLYYKLGFSLKSENPPDYKYVVNDKRAHKSKFRKSKTGLSESKLNLPKIWDCGKIKFELIIKGV
jgi:hypothetical protein